MANDTLTRRILSLSPYIEIILRRVYWSNIGRIPKKTKKSNKAGLAEKPAVDYSSIKRFLVDNGATQGGLLLVHSAFGPLKGRGKTADQVLDFLLEIVGPHGTLAMPAMPKFKNAIKTEDYLKPSDSDVIYEYDVKKSKIKTGVLPLMLHKRKESRRSLFPINTMVALGPLAEKLFQGNLEGDSPLACGVNSSWKRCVDNNALIVGLGTDLTHSLTAIHVAEDVQDQTWPIKNWYIEKKFRITDGDYSELRVLRERAPKWGALHFAERTLCRDLMSEGILISTEIDGVLVEVIKAKELLSYLNKRNHKGYPYYGI